MATARVQIYRADSIGMPGLGGYNVTLTLTTPGTAWVATPDPNDHPITSTLNGGKDPGPGGIAFEAWRFGPSFQSTKMRRIEVNGQRLYIETDYGEGNPYELWLYIQSSVNQVHIDIKKDFVANSADGNLLVCSQVDTQTFGIGVGSTMTVTLTLW